MKIKILKIKNFRGYHNEVSINFEDLTAFVGKNDVGKSSILTALDIFFNEAKPLEKLEKEDINKNAIAEGDNEITISVVFDDLPAEVIIDAQNTTTLQQEYLLNREGLLEIIKKYPNAGKAKTLIRAYHPTQETCCDLLLKKNSDLRKILSDNNITCDDRTRNAEMRKSIWNHYSNVLNLNMVDIDVTKGDTKSIWEKLQTYLPIYTLFQSDRKNSDGDSEIQDPLKEAVKEILGDRELRETLDNVATEVERKLTEVSNRTLSKLREMDPEVANSLTPIIPSAAGLKWADVFKNVSIAGDNDIPINKRGSGVKRLVLLNFFRAEAERRISEISATGIIYAIEEPETSQHTENQKKIIRAFIDLARAQNTQIIITTHSANIVKALQFSNLRLILKQDEERTVENVSKGNLPYPSLNEVNYLAFSEITEEYHNELYGFIAGNELLAEFKQGKSTMPYRHKLPNGGERLEQKVLSEYIRHQIHHPENKLNTHFTEEQLKESIELMRNFICEKINCNN